MVAEQPQDIIAQESEVRESCQVNGKADQEALAPVEAPACGAKEATEVSEVAPRRPTKEDEGSDLSTDAGSDSEENATESDGPDVAPPLGFTAEETLLIFDWDDTILPSTWVKHQGLRLDSSSVPTQEQFAQLRRCADSATRTLQLAMQRGRVIIVTNGEQGWVELSCWKFMPSLAPLLEGIQIISARSTYEKQGLQSPFDWKLYCFRKEIHGYYASAPAGIRRNVLSLGDSMQEHMALINVSQGMANCRAKSLKFASLPDLEQLVEQHELVSGRLHDIVDHDGDLGLEVLAA